MPAANLRGNQPVRRVHAAVLAPSSGIATPSSRRRADGVEDDATIQRERAVNFVFTQVTTQRS